MGVPFVYADWIAAYPEFNVPPTVVLAPQAQRFFAQADLYFDNGPSAPARFRITDEQQTQIMWMLVAHLAQLRVGSNGQAASGLVGRISSASEGSVSVSTEFPTTANSAWFLQTPYGADFWQATAALRTMHYRPKQGRFGNGLGPGAGLIR